VRWRRSACCPSQREGPVRYNVSLQIAIFEARKDGGCGSPARNRLHGGAIPCRLACDGRSGTRCQESFLRASVHDRRRDAITTDTLRCEGGLRYTGVRMGLGAPSPCFPGGARRLQGDSRGWLAGANTVGRRVRVPSPLRLCLDLPGTRAARSRSVPRVPGSRRDPHGYGAIPGVADGRSPARPTNAAQPC
jgi:hypothetical protein